mgnify:CR=1 FL=1
MTRRLGDLLAGIDTTTQRGDMGLPVSGIAYDSRRVEPGFLFVAIRGTKQDGGQFVKDALSRGAIAVVADVPLPRIHDAAVIEVADSRKALAHLAANYYDHPARELRLVGITGTNGKTTTSLLIESILRSAGHSVGVLGTLAYRWAGTVRKAPMTTPESLDLQCLFTDMRKVGVTHVVMEVSSHALALGRVEGCGFDACVFTNLSQDHLDFHASMEEYFNAKSRLFTEYVRCDERGKGIAVVNADDPYGEHLIKLLKSDCWSYSIQNRDAAVWVSEAELTPEGIKAILSTPKGPLQLQSRLIGRLNLYNLVAAATTALALGLDMDEVARGLAAVTSVDGRLEPVPLPPDAGFSVVVDYAHTPDAMEKALECLREMTHNRLIVVFGCGGDRDRGKRPLMGKMAARWGDLVILTSDNPRGERPEAIVAEIENGVRETGWKRLESNPSPSDRNGYVVEVDRRRAIELALECARRGDIVFIGGKGHETYQIVGTQVVPFDDRIVVRDTMARKGS